MQTIEYKSGRGKQLHLDKLKAIAKGVMDVEAVEADDGVISDDFDVVLLEARAQGGHVHDADRGMRFDGRAEVLLHANMQLVHAALQPNATATLQSWRLGQFGHAKHVNVKLSRDSFTAGRRSHLDVIDPKIKVHLPPERR
jgi:hypothetical protein